MSEQKLLVYLKCKRVIAIKYGWVQNPIIHEESVVFYGPDSEENPDFTLPEEYYLNKTKRACYRAAVMQKFDPPNSLEKAQYHMEHKRLIVPAKFKSGMEFGSNPVEFIDIESSDDEQQCDFGEDQNEIGDSVVEAQMANESHVSF